MLERWTAELIARNQEVNAVHEDPPNLVKRCFPQVTCSKCSKLISAIREALKVLGDGNLLGASDTLEAALQSAHLEDEPAIVSESSDLPELP